MNMPCPSCGAPAFHEAGCKHMPAGTFETMAPLFSPARSAIPHRHIETEPYLAEDPAEVVRITLLALRRIIRDHMLNVPPFQDLSCEAVDGAILLLEQLEAQ